MKAREARRYLEYLGHECQDSAPVTEGTLLSKKRCGLALAALAALVLLGVVYNVFRSHPGDTMAAMADIKQIVSEDIRTAASTLAEDSSLSIRANDDGPGSSPSCSKVSSCWFHPPKLTPCCVGAWYPIVVGLWASPGR